MAWPGRPAGTAAQVTTDCRSWHWHLVAGTNLEDSPLLTRAASPDGTASQASSRTPSPPGLPLEELSLRPALVVRRPTAQLTKCLTGQL